MTSRPQKLAAARSSARQTAKNTATTGQKSRKGAAPAVPHNDTDGGEDVDPPAATKKAPRTFRQGTRASSRLRGQNQGAITHQPAPIEPEAVRKRKLNNVKNAAVEPKPPQRRVTVADVDEDEEMDTPAQAGPATSDPSPVDPATDHDEEPAEAAEPLCLSPPDDGFYRRFYVRRDENGKAIGMCMGLFPNIPLPSQDLQGLGDMQFAYEVGDSDIEDAEDEMSS